MKLNLSLPLLSLIFFLLCYFLQIEKIVREANFSRTGAITYSEFAAVMMLEMGMVDSKRLEDVFEYYACGQKDIGWMELEQVLFPHSNKFEHDCRKIVAEATDDRSKTITFRDFKRIILPDSGKFDESSRNRSQRQ